MKHRFRHTAAFALATVALLPLLALALLQAAQVGWKGGCAERLETETLTEVVVPIADAVWEEEGEELWVGGRLFDVKTMERRDGAYYLTGVFDDAETSIVQLLQGWAQKKTGHWLRVVLLLQCFGAVVAVVRFGFLSEKTQHRHRFLQRLLPSPLRCVLAPPPRPSLPPL